MTTRPKSSASTTRPEGVARGNLSAVASGSAQMPYSRPIPVPRKWSSAWWEPGALLAAVGRSNKRISFRRFFNDPSPEMHSRHEAYIAALFATILRQHERCLSLRMEAGSFPDFHLCTAEAADLPFEVTEADRAGRRRGLEYRHRRRVISYDAVEEEAEAQRVIPLRVKNKATKRYCPPPHLLVYVNLSAFELRAETDRDLLNSLQPWASRFGSIWLLWGANATQLAPTLERMSALRDPFTWPDPVLQ
jgi:hypothetical protein